MIQKIIYSILLSFSFIVHANGQNRTISLLQKMTIEEKVSQLRSSFAANPKINTAFFENKFKLDSLFANGVAMINPDFGNSMEESIENRNKTQAYLRKTKSGIPAIFLDEAHHGLLAMQTDVFPTSIGLACSWDTLLVSKLYNYAADQARSRGTRMVLSPVIDVTRDPRWGRTGETFGEDPFLCGVMGAAVVRGFQERGVAATLKHFTGHGQSIGGINQAPADYPERVLRQFHMEPFRIAIQRSNPAAIMPAYIEIDGIPVHASSWLLKDILRKEWNYKGVIVSDWWAIDQLFNKHKIVPTRKDAALAAFNAGVTVDLPYGNNYENLIALVKEKKISMKDLDSAVVLVLRLKQSLGLLDETKDIALSAAKQWVAQPKGRELARIAAEQSMVLLKNQPFGSAMDGILPLDINKVKKIAVVGPCAAVNYLGDYSGVSVHNVSILEGIRNRFGNVVYAKGVDLSLNGDTISLNNYQYTHRLQTQTKEKNLQLIQEAVATAKDADVIICAIGENEQYSREAGNPDRFGDVSTLDLVAQQNELVAALVATGKPVIVYLAHGRPLSINLVKEKATAIVDGWYTGMEAGNAFANILFGDVNPSGKLTISVPKSVGQLPIYYNRKPSEHHFEYVQEDNQPLYPFGYGLSYTTYKYGPLKLEGNKVSVTITNTGKRAGQEIVQLYIRPQAPSVVQPVKALKDFAKIQLSAGETKTISFTISEEHLKIWDRQMQFKAEPGLYEIMIGPNSSELQKINYQFK